MFAGVVRRVGKGVTDFNVGDEVFGFLRSKWIKSVVQLPNELVMLKPKYLTLEQATIVPGKEVTLILISVMLRHTSFYIFINNNAKCVFGTFNSRDLYGIIYRRKIMMIVSQLTLESITF